MYIKLMLIYLLCVIRIRVRYCTCKMWRMLLPYGKLIGLLLFYLLLFLFSILFFKPNVLAYNIFLRNELARPVMGTIFLVIPNGLAFMWCDLDS